MLSPGVQGDPQYNMGIQSENAPVYTQPTAPGGSLAVGGGRPGSAMQLVDGVDLAEVVAALSGGHRDARLLEALSGVAADAGYRLTPERTRGVTEIATAFFPRKVAGLQAARDKAIAEYAAAIGEKS